MMQWDVIVFVFLEFCSVWNNLHKERYMESHKDAMNR